MKGPLIFQSYEQNILRDAVITSTVAPMTTFDLDTLLFGRPDFRVRWNTGTVTIRFKHPGSPPDSRRGDIFVLPMHNLDPSGSPALVRLTNDVGMSQDIPVPDSLENGLPRTIVVDLTIGTPIVGQRTPTYWDLHIAGNSVPVILGGAIGIYAPKTFLVDRDAQWGYLQRRRGMTKEQANQYGTFFRQNFRTMLRSIDLSLLATEADADAVEAWFIANNGRGLPGLLWFDPTIEDAYFGVWQDTFERTRVYDDAEQIAVKFEELSKGLPLR